MNKGFTLIEILVASMVFLIVISVAIGLFVSLLRYQRRTLAEQELLNQSSYIIEYMGRAIRMALKDGAGLCLSQAGLNYKNPLGDVSRIRFINHSENDICQEFFWDKVENQLKESKSGNPPISLTSNDLQVNFLKFNLSGQSEDDDFQPRVTIFLEIQIKGPGGQPKTRIQTTISQRNLDVK